MAVAAYLGMAVQGFASGEKPAWRGKNTIAADRFCRRRRSIRSRARRSFSRSARVCHGEDGQGIQIGDKKAAPLWGPSSWNDGAGAARVYTLAGIIRYAMPYLDPGTLTDEEAQLLAAFITSRARPAYPFKDKDYVNSGPPVDAVYYRSPN